MYPSSLCSFVLAQRVPGPVCQDVKMLYFAEGYGGCPMEVMVCMSGFSVQRG